MFKKLYKEANDEIPSNTELLLKLRNEAKKEKRHPSYSLIYKYGFAAAAVLIITVSVSVLPKIEETNEEVLRMTEYSSNEEVVAEDKVTEETDAKTEVFPLKQEKTDETTVKNTPQKTANEKPKETVRESEKQEAVLPNEESENKEVQKFTEDNASAESGSEQSVDSAETDSESVPEEAVEKRTVEKGTVSGGGAAPAGVAAAHFMSEPEYSFQIPEGMSMTFSSDGNPEENPVFMYSGENKSLTITVFPDPTEVVYAMNRAGGEAKDEKIKQHSEKAFTAYTVKDGTGYVIESNGLTEEEIYNIINSIK